MTIHEDAQVLLDVCKKYGSVTCSRYAPYEEIQYWSLDQFLIARDYLLFRGEIEQVFIETRTGKWFTKFRIPTRTLTPLEAQARSFAAEAHAAVGQLYDGMPYAVHLDEVVSILREYDCVGETLILTGYLHDVLEDTPNEYENIAAGFGTVVADAVEFCTDAPGENRKERKAATYARCKANPNPVGVVVKVADRLANVRSCTRWNPKLLRMYARERDAFKDAYYVAGLCPFMWHEYDKLLGTVDPGPPARVTGHH